MLPAGLNRGDGLYRRDTRCIGLPTVLRTSTYLRGKGNVRNSGLRGHHQQLWVRSWRNRPCPSLVLTTTKHTIEKVSCA